MSRSSMVSLVVVSLVAAGCASARPAGDAAVAKQQFERIKSLEGTWATAPGAPMEAQVVYRVIGNGSTVQETLLGGTPMEMVTMYHLDGDALFLTHYCAAGNQPTMRALPSSDPAEIVWEFVSLSNGDPAKDMHMHNAVMRFEEDGRLRSWWTGWQDGKPGEHDVTFDLSRAR